MVNKQTNNKIKALPQVKKDQDQDQNNDDGGAPKDDKDQVHDCEQAQDDA